MSKDQIPPHFIVFVPGYMGSMLWNEEAHAYAWLGMESMLLDVLAKGLQIERSIRSFTETLKYPRPLKANHVLQHLLYAPPWIRTEKGYAPLLEFLATAGYAVDPQTDDGRPAVYTFPYDWRQDNRESGRRLAQAVDRWRAVHPGAQAWIIAHSNGGLVARWYIEREGGKQHVGRLFLLASPRDGTPKAMYLAHTGLDQLMRHKLNAFGLQERSREMFRTFPSIYQLLPEHNPYLHGIDNQPLDAMAAAGHWLAEPEQKLLRDAQAFRAELGTQLSVDTICLYGTKQPTRSEGIVHTGAGGRWEEIEWPATVAGDGTLPEWTAVFPEAGQNIAYAVDHGHIYQDKNVLALLKYELIDRYGSGQERASLQTHEYRISFLPQPGERAAEGSYRPGERISLWAEVRRLSSDSLVQDARVTARLKYLDALPGSPAPAAALVADGVRLRYGEGDSYTGSLAAPETEGYYQLTATVALERGPSFELQELIAIEGDA